MKYYVLLGMVLMAFFAGCTQEESLNNNQDEDMEEIHFGPNPGD